MPEEIQNNTATLPSQPVQNNSAAIARDLGDQELDGALNKLFNKTPDEKPPEPVEPPEPTTQKASPVKVEVVEKQDKPSDPKEQIIDPDKIDESIPKATKEGWNALKNNYKRANKIAQEREQEVSKLKSLLSERGENTSKQVEELNKKIEELTAYRAMVDIQADPEFVNKYDAPFNKNVESIKSLLGDLDVSDAVIDTVDFNDDYRLKELLGLVISNRQHYKPAQIYAYQKAKTLLEETIDLREKRDFSIVEQKTKHKEYLENKKKESFTKTAEAEGRITKRLESVAKNIPFLNKMAPKEGATEAEINQVELHNKMVEGMTNKVSQVLKMDTPEDKAEIAVAAVASHYLSSQLKSANDRIASLEGEIKKISNVSSETERTKPTGVARRSNNGNGQIPDTDTAMSEFFTRSR